MWNIIFLISLVIFSLLLILVNTLKKCIKTKENTIFKRLSVFTLLSVSVELLLQILTLTLGPQNIFTEFFQRLYLFSITICFAIFSIYVFTILIPIFNKDEKKYNLLNYIHTGIVFGSLILYFTLDIKYHFTPEYMYTEGPAVNLLKFVIGGYLVLWVILSLINIKRVLKKSYIPILSIFILMIINLILQTVNPTLLLVSLTLVLIIYLMYFTIENPDLKMIEELYKNKTIMEETYIDKSNFLFEMTQDVRDPINNIDKECDLIKESKNIKDYKKALENIKAYTKELDYLVNDALNVNTIDVQKIKIINNKYNFNNIFEQLVSQVSDKISDRIKFDYACSKDIPELYGDSIKIKQLISSLLMESIRRTKEGFISFKVDTIERFDALRLIIEIKDSSSGVPIETINKILNTTTEISKKDIELLEKNEININLCQKVVKLMNGKLLIKSASKKGTTMLLTIDQKINNRKEDISIYEKYLSDNKKIAIVSQDKKLSEYLRKFFNKNDIKNTIILNGNYLIDDLKRGKHYDYLIFENDMKEINGYTLFKKISDEGFIIPTFLIIKDPKMEKHFIDEGFTEVILLDNLESGIENIIKKY